MSSSFLDRPSIFAARSAISVSRAGGAASAEHALRRRQLLPLAGYARLRVGVVVIAAHALGDLGEVARALGRHDRALRARLATLALRQRSRLQLQPMLRQRRRHVLVERGHAVVVEARGDRAEHRHRVRRLLEQLAIALVLLAHVAQRVGRALAIELVDRDEVGEVEHVDLLELRCGAELGRHHVQRHVDQRHDRRVALADARSLDDDKVEASRLACGDRIGQCGGDLGARVARRERAHVDVRMADRVHPDAVTEQRATGLAPRRVDRKDRDTQRVLLVEPEPAHQLVGERALARAAGARDAQHRRLHLARGGSEIVAKLLRNGATFETADEARERAGARIGIRVAQRRERRRQRLREVHVGRGDDLVDHALQAELLPVLRREDPRDAVVVQRLDLGRHDDAATAAEHLDVPRAALAQQVDHVPEELDVAALVGRDRDAVRVLLQRAGDDLLDGAVVPEVDHLAAAGLQDAPHDVDRRIVAIEEARGRDEAHLVLRLVDERRTGRIVHGGLHRTGDRQTVPERRLLLRHGRRTLYYVYVNVN